MKRQTSTPREMNSKSERIARGELEDGGTLRGGEGKETSRIEFVGAGAEDMNVSHKNRTGRIGPRMGSDLSVWRVQIS